MDITYRRLERADNPIIAALIRTILEEFHIDRPGTAYTDPSTDDLFSLFAEPRSVYFVAQKEGIIAGGCGIYPTNGLPPDCAELVKYYVLPQERGQGIGKKLMELCFESAMNLGYSRLYLETVPELADAIRIYERAGFEHIQNAMGNSGHFFCNIRMLKDLKNIKE
jgi:putative acetyltransferase